MRHRRGEIVWVNFPFTDISRSKMRPALIISNEMVNKTGDYLLMQITTRLRQDGLSIIINEADYVGTPLRKQAELRVHKIFILNEDLINQTITHVSAKFLNRVIEKVLSVIQ